MPPHFKCFLTASKTAGKHNTGSQRVDIRNCCKGKIALQICLLFLCFFLYCFMFCWPFIMWWISINITWCEWSVCVFFKRAISLHYRWSTNIVMSKQIFSPLKAYWRCPWLLNKIQTQILSHHEPHASASVERLLTLVAATSGGVRSYFLSNRVLHSPWCWIKNSDRSKAQLQDTRRVKHKYAGAASGGQFIQIDTSPPSLQTNVLSGCSIA